MLWPFALCGIFSRFLRFEQISTNRWMAPFSDFPPDERMIPQICGWMLTIMEKLTKNALNYERMNRETAIDSYTIEQRIALPVP